MKFLFQILFLASVVILNTSATRHIIYWDDDLTPTLSKDIGLTIDAGINDWMDILCPHLPDKRLWRHKNNHLFLQIYNVTEDDFINCNTHEKDRVLRCSDPSTESKLTTKFQRISPSPWGFAFRPGHTYYYISRPLHDRSKNCHSKHVMKLKVKINRNLESSRGGLKTYHVINEAYKENSTKQERAPRHHTKSPTVKLQKTTLKVTSSSKPTVKSVEENKPKIARSQSQKPGGENSANPKHSRSILTIVCAILLTILLL